MQGIQKYKKYFATLLPLMSKAEVKKLQRLIKSMGRDTYLSQIDVLKSKYRLDHCFFHPINQTLDYMEPMDECSKMLVILFLMQTAKKIICYDLFLKHLLGKDYSKGLSASESIKTNEQFAREYGNPYTKWFWYEICPPPFDY